jgi:PKD repeat protein
MFIEISRRDMRRLSKSSRYAVLGLLSGMVLILAGCPGLMNQPPVAIADASPLEGEAPLTVTFDGSQSFDPDGTIASFEWNFNDGSPTATGEIVTHEFESEGVFKVVLTVTDGQGSKDSDVLFITVGRAQIYFSSNRTGDFELFRMETDGDNQARVTFAPASIEVFPSLVPNTRNLLAFTSDRDTPGFFDIFVSNPDGTLPSNLTAVQTASDEIEPSWSPNGAKIAFASDQTGDWEIFIMNADGSGKAQLTSNVGFDVAPAISPDGTKIIFVSDRDGDFEIFVMNIDGTNVTQLTSNADGDGAQGPDLFGLGFGISVPSWSPDGTKIAFTSDRDGGDFDIFIMDADGTNVTQLTTSSADDYDPFWLPNGEEIVFVSDRDGGIPQLFKINVATKVVDQLTATGATDVTPASLEDGD